MASQGNGYIVCEVHLGIGSSKVFPKEHFERNPEDKIKKNKKNYQESTLKECEQKNNFKNNCSPVANQMTKQSNEVI